MFTLAPAIPQPAFSPLHSRHQFDRYHRPSMSDHHTPTAPREEVNTNASQQNSNPFTFCFSGPANACPAPSSSSSPSRFAQRYAATISQPAARVAERHTRDKRRDVFLNKVKRDRRANQFDARSDQMQRSDFLEQQRRFEEEMARSEPQFEYVEGEEEEEVMNQDAQEEDFDDALLEDFIAEEENGYMALVEYAPKSEIGKEPLDSDMFDDDTLEALLQQIESRSHQQMDTSGS